MGKFAEWWNGAFWKTTGAVMARHWWALMPLRSTLLPYSPIIILISLLCLTLYSPFLYIYIPIIYLLLSHFYSQAILLLLLSIITIILFHCCCWCCSLHHLCICCSPCIYLLIPLAPHLFVISLLHSHWPLSFILFIPPHSRQFYICSGPHFVLLLLLFGWSFDLENRVNICILLVIYIYIYLLWSALIRWCRVVTTFYKISFVVIPHLPSTLTSTFYTSGICWPHFAHSLYILFYLMERSLYTHLICSGQGVSLLFHIWSLLRSFYALPYRLHTTHAHIPHLFTLLLYRWLGLTTIFVTRWHAITIVYHFVPSPWFVLLLLPSPHIFVPHLLYFRCHIYIYRCPTVIFTHSFGSVYYYPAFTFTYTLPLFCYLYIWMVLLRLHTRSILPHAISFPCAFLLFITCGYAIFARYICYYSSYPHIPYPFLSLEQMVVEGTRRVLWWVGDAIHLLLLFTFIPFPPIIYLFIPHIYLVGDTPFALIYHCYVLLLDMMPSFIFSGVGLGGWVIIHSVVCLLLLLLLTPAPSHPLYSPIIVILPPTFPIYLSCYLFPSQCHSLLYCIYSFILFFIVLYWLLWPIVGDLLLLWWKYLVPLPHIIPHCPYPPLCLEESCKWKAHLFSALIYLLLCVYCTIYLLYYWYYCIIYLNLNLPPRNRVVTCWWSIPVWVRCRYVSRFVGGTYGGICWPCIAHSPLFIPIYLFIHSIVSG